MAQKTAEQIVKKYQSGVSSGAQAYADGVANPTRPWAAATTAAASRWRSGVQEAINNNSFQRGVQKAGDTKWQTAAAEKGAQNYAAAASNAAAAYQQVASQIVAAGNAARQAASSMPGDTQEQRIAKAAAAMRATSNYWKNR